MKIQVAAAKDTLRKIAQAHRLELSDLILMNRHISDPDSNLSGMNVFIPDKAAMNRNQTALLSCPPEIPARLIDQWIPLTPLSEMTDIEYDVLIIGTGGGGGAMLWRLCERLRSSRMRIAVVERGDLLLPTHALNVPTFWDWSRMLEYFLNPKISTPIGKFLPEYSGARLVYALGGRTLFWGATTPRLPAFELASWPISYKELETYYNIAEQAMAVNAGTLTPLSRVILGRLWEGGYPESSALPQAIGRGQFSSIVFMGEALRYRPYELAVNARAVQVMTENGKAAGVKVMSPDKKPFFLKAKKVVVSAGALESPHLLLHSGIPGRAIGHYLINHSFLKSPGKVADALPDGGGSILIPQSEDRPYQVQMYLFGGTDYLCDMFGRVEPQYENSVTLDELRKDEYGVPGIQVHFSYSSKDKSVISRMVDGANKIASAIGGSLASTAGMPEICILPPGADYHEAGTCRMGNDPAFSATDPFGQIHGVSGLYVADNSVLPTIGAVNPTLTTSALAMRTADHIIRQLMNDG
ncbi:GMC family oxidoreductase [Paenibacillus sp. LHD-38]|uniref:GMC family oxidoreductase n=1 Tax=Paenibacillus sp. LHD-38 TaxID=3072143 RepID=UPI002810450A|nr:GMC family oxidoreductase [Paenibacillus sp. LHD-38]MDQ8738598.1 GMC family oxidoreductase [Paenibacillus sp. LHD-38]